MSTFSKKITHWYKQNKRELPWRKTQNPYLIWVSEIILQQTRVAQGYDYYERFVERFPNYQSLAQAPEKEVLNYWQGLGYYSRARNMHKAAQSIKDRFPSTYKDVLALKGVGDYTAAAICSFAYNLPHATVDGNVYRVLSRYFGISTPIDSTSGQKEFKALAQELLCKEDPAQHNQAIMEFGALQCTPKSPKCDDCPLNESCIALSEGLIDNLPYKAKKIKTKHRYFYYFYATTPTALYLHKREKKDIWQGLYEFPLIEMQTPVSLEELLKHSDLSKWIQTSQEVHFTLKAENVKHILSHQTLHTTLYQVALPEESKSLEGFIKITHEELKDYPLSRLTEILLKKL